LVGSGRSLKVSRGQKRHPPLQERTDLATRKRGFPPALIAALKLTAPAQKAITRFAKYSGASVFLVGHVTKEGMIAGPRVLEHMVDTVLYFEGDDSSRFRILRSTKNRYGPVHELGIFAMTEGGLRPVTNPSAIFLQRHTQGAAGSVVMVCQGSRPLLIEVQALVDQSFLANPRRVAVGLDHAYPVDAQGRHG